MSCCRKNRRQWQQRALDHATGNIAPEPTLENPVEVYYRGSGSFLLTGKLTGNVYLFCDQEPLLKIDYRDAVFILADTQRFSIS